MRRFRSLDRISRYARDLGLPRVYIACNSGARIGLVESLKPLFKVAWKDDSNPSQGFEYVGWGGLARARVPSRLPFLVVAANVVIFLPHHVPPPPPPRTPRYLYLSEEDYNGLPEGTVEGEMISGRFVSPISTSEWEPNRSAPCTQSALLPTPSPNF